MSEIKKLEAIIRKGQTAFFAAARALLEIDRRELWRPEFSSIVDYAAARFDFSASDVSRYRNAGVVLENLAECERLPVNEAQCRELAKLRHKEPQVRVWGAAVESGKKITAKLIAETAERLLDGGEEDEFGPSAQPGEERTAIHEVVTAARFLKAARDRVEALDEDGRRSLMEQIKIIEQEIEELRACLSLDLITA